MVPHEGEGTIGVGPVDGVAHRVGDVVVLLVPVRRSRVQRVDPVGISRRQPAVKDVAEQLVETVRPRVTPDTDHEEVGGLERLEPICGVVSSGERPAPVGVELVEGGQGEETIEALRVDLCEHLAGEVVGDVVIGSGEGPHERGRVGVVTHRERRQVHAGGPTLRARLSTCRHRLARARRRSQRPPARSPRPRTAAHRFAPPRGAR